MQMVGVSDQGQIRANNEDRWLARILPDGQVLLAVADGMGGQAAGERAAQVIMDILAEYDPASGSPLDRLVRQADEAIRSTAAQDPELKGMGSTLTAALVSLHVSSTGLPDPGSQAGEAHWVHVGDSRLYLCRIGTVRQVTRDHRLVQELIDGGLITQEEARTHPLRNILEQCVGCPGLGPEVGTLAVQTGDILLLSTDGLHDQLEGKMMAEILSAPGDLQSKANRLVATALASGSRDNVTVVLAEI